ncbi:MAG TPA: error-prone DNA polymerase [Stellaceae bacterium]|nr:error-prone DNA polymerase [Stellaceae bacterium]
MPELPPEKSNHPDRRLAAFGKLSRTIGSGSAGPQGEKRARPTGGPTRRPADVAPGYAELQVTSNFSFLRGASHPDELVATAAVLGHEAIAITDRNSVAGIVRAHHAAKTVGIRLVVGCRLDLRDGTSLLAYPEDRAAYGRLTRLLTLGKRRAQKGECHLDYADVVAHGEGQIVVVLPPEQGDAAEFAARAAADFAGRAYLAAHHLYRGDDAKRLARLARLGERIGLPLVAVNDVLYHVPERRPLQDVVTCIREHCTIAEAGFRLAANAERHLKPAAEMARLFRGHEEALVRSLEIAGRCRFSLDELRYEYPEEPVPAGMTAQQRLAQLVWEGAAERLASIPSPVPRERGRVSGMVTRGIDPRVPEVPLERNPTWCKHAVSSSPGLTRRSREPLQMAGSSPAMTACVKSDLVWKNIALNGRAEPGRDGENPIPPHLRARIEHELALIEQLDFARYFLTVHDIVRHARSKGILCQGRGSAANSVVCYCLGITSVDPSRIDVLFERFISAARNEPPDIDVDFGHERREEVIQYIYEKYTRDRAGIAATVICYRARGAIREVGKVMGLSGDVVAAMAGLVWGWSNEGIADERVREAGLDPRDRTLRLALDLAAELIGFPRHLSQHVGGFVITRGPLCELVPIENAAMEDRTVIEWDKDDLDGLGILKIDILALGMLTCIRKSFDLIERHYGKHYTLATIPAEQKPVYDMLSKADSLGVFQVESRAQMTMLPRLKPREFYDLVIEVAIVRPGPIQGDMVHPYLRRRNGKEPVEYPSEALRRVLGKTLGVPLFQEQAMRIAIVGAGFPPEEADRLRRAMATFKRNGDIHLFRDRFVAGMIANGYTADFATRCFSQIEGFGTYGFPESHAASFALLVYVSAWIKCFHPDVFACALLNSQPMGFYAPAQIVRDAREHGVEVRPVDVNFSDRDCTLEPLSKPSKAVMPGLDPGIPGTAISAGTCREGVDGRVKPGHDDKRYEGYALRLGLRQIKGFAAADAEKLVAARGAGYRNAEDLWRRSGLGRAALERLADADALRSLGFDRRQALWALKALGDPPPPLFAPSLTLPRSRGREGWGWEGESVTAEAPSPVRGLAPAAILSRIAGEGSFSKSSWPGLTRPSSDPPEIAGSSPAMTIKERSHMIGLRCDSETRAAALLPEMALGEHVVEDYAHLGLTLKRHPLAFLRAELAAEGMVCARDLATLPVGRRLEISGIVLIRQRPGSANGVVFVTIEDETGVANLIVWPDVLERFRRAALGATLLYCKGRPQREESVIHLVADELRDLTPRLHTLRDRTGDASPPNSAAIRSEKIPGYNTRDIVIPSRDFR